MRHVAERALLLLVIAVPVSTVVTFWANGGRNQHSTPLWWWVLAAANAILYIASRWPWRRERSAGMRRGHGRVLRRH